jgi:hypothetical protein
MVDKYDGTSRDVYDRGVNVDEDLMKDKIIEDVGRIVSSKGGPAKNYSNFNLDGDKKSGGSHSKERKQFKNQILKSRLRRYNDSNHHDIEEVFDVTCLLI